MPGGPGSTALRHLSEWDTTVFQSSATGYHDLTVAFTVDKLMTFTIDGQTVLVSNFNASGYMPASAKLLIGGSTTVSLVNLTFSC